MCTKTNNKLSQRRTSACLLTITLRGPEGRGVPFTVTWMSQSPALVGVKLTTYSPGLSFSGLENVPARIEPSASRVSLVSILWLPLHGSPSSSKRQTRRWDSVCLSNFLCGRLTLHLVISGCN